MENTITISIEEYKGLVRTSIEKEFHEQIIGLQDRIKQMEEVHASDTEELRSNSMYWYQRWEAENKKVDALKEELEFYKPASQQEAS